MSPIYNSNAAVARHHTEWLSLIEISGPFLSMPVLMRVFPQGLEVRDTAQAQELRAVYEEWQDNQQGLQPDPALHRAWIEYVLADLLGFGPLVLQPYSALGAADQGRWSAPMPEHHETLRPDYVLVNPPGQGQPEPTARLLVQILPPGRKLNQAPAGSAWVASAEARMQALLHATGVRLGLLTNGEEWMLVDAQQGQTTGYTRWYAELWFDEPVTLRAFTTLLGAYRFFAVPAPDQLEALLTESVNNQQEVTDQLGHQVRRAVELLVQAIDKADQEQGRTLLVDITMPELYAAAVTVMMRLVFLLSAEERRLLPLESNPLYTAHYAVSTLHNQLRSGADQTGEEVLEYHHDSHARLLATFNAVYNGVYHDRWVMPAYGGGLFDPSAIPFLTQPGLRIDNRTVLHLLESLQYLEVAVPGGEKQRRRVSFRALDIEQIGHVYEGLLDHTAVRATETVVGLAGTRNKEPEIALRELETRQGDRAKLLAYLKEQTGRSENSLRSALEAGAPDMLRATALRSACDNDESLYQRVAPWHALIRDDDYGRPVVFAAGSVYVTAGAERRATGTHYTPRSLTEPIVQHTLEPLVYVGPAQGQPREQWALRSLDDLLDLKICDMAMGSGAFLVQACRYLSERVVEAYEQAVRLRLVSKASASSPLAVLHGASDAEERLLLARRLVASRCLYGVDKNPLAVEMAKLSLWLITLDQGSPFTFLDHALKCGDSLVGVDLEQLRRWSLHADVTAPLDALHIDVDIERMVRLRQEIEALPSLDIYDLGVKKIKLAQADAIAHELKRAGDLLVASYYNTLPKAEQERLRAALLTAVREGTDLDDRWDEYADLGALRPFHWPLEFPEVFLGGTRTGFDSFVGNPPFIGGKRVRDTLGDNYRIYLNDAFPNSTGNTDYCALFFIRGYNYLNHQGTLGLIATNTIAQGDTRVGGLKVIEDSGGTIYRANGNRPWPGGAAVVVSVIHIINYKCLQTPYLNDSPVQYISTLLDSSTVVGEPYHLMANEEKSHIGSYVNGLGFVLSPEEAQVLLERNPQNQAVLFQYLTGEDLNSHPEQMPSRWIINFFDWAQDKAQKYTDCMSIVQSKVWPERKDKKGSYATRWWQYGRRQERLYEAITPLKKVLAVAQTSRTLAFSFVPNGYVYAMMTVIFAFEEEWAFAVLQSAFHEAWARKYASTMKQDLRYTPTDIFGNFPFPSLIESIPLEDIGATYHEHRRGVMLDRWEGLTASYNRFHKPDESAEDIARLRQLHVEMDYAVAAAYGWGDLDLGHGFHETAQGIRYTIAEAARRTVLTRLLELNHARYAEEVKAGLHDKKKGKGKAKGKSGAADEQMEMW